MKNCTALQLEGRPTSRQTLWAVLRVTTRTSKSKSVNLRVPQL